VNTRAAFSLLKKYDKAGPRYTSYPTVPAWSSEFDHEAYRNALARLPRGRRTPLSIYLHLPFCAKRCHYCGCNAVQGDGSKSVDSYLDCVERELELIGDALGGPSPATHVHWGGGTPNYLNESQIHRARRLISETFSVTDDAEISLEADPRLGTAEQAAMLRQAGFNRISLGVQDVDAAVQRAIGRNQSEGRTRRFYRECREAGFESVNIDLVYGLPAQTADSFSRTLEAVLDLSPDRIACFSYAHVPWIRSNQNAIDAGLLPSAQDKFSLFVQAVTALTGAGYEWIGIDHFAKAGDDLAEAYRARVLHRNFMGYTTDEGAAMVGLGMSGISDTLDCFAQNSSDLAEYQRALKGGALPTVRGHALTAEDRLRRAVITHLMCNMELPFDLTATRFGVRIDEKFKDEIERMRTFADDGLVAIEPEGLRVTETGRFFVRNICMEWDSYMGKSADRPVFSRTV
jgi:oxygen-independent coproporphyrinogen-3 oxidase